ncbi:MAG TPA: hypothetical protein VFG05_00195 [Methylocella sp.]|nr:hypothetical protein [Methylocella sp.]
MANQRASAQKFLRLELFFDGFWLLPLAIINSYLGLGLSAGGPFLKMGSWRKKCGAEGQGAKSEAGMSLLRVPVLRETGGERMPQRGRRNAAKGLEWPN